MRRKTSIVLMILGVLIAAYPLLQRSYSQYMQQRLMEELASGALVASSVEDLQSSEELEQLQQLLQAGEGSDIEMEEMGNTNNETQEALPPAEPPQQQRALGILEIPKISLSLPILEGATEKNLRIASARVKGTAELGEIGNTAIAAHRSHTFGRFFNRLAELQKGDEIQIISEGNTLIYEVYNVVVVEPTDVSVLKGNNRDKILTLITCDPQVKPTHRLIVQAIQL